MQTIDNFSFKDIKALIRVDFNVPLDGQNQITDTTRIDATIPTITKILNDGGAVILMSHLGRPKGGPEEKYSLKHVIPYLSKKLNRPVQFADDCIGQSATDLAGSLKPGEVLLLENLRFHKEEEGKAKVPDTATDEEKKAAKAEMKKKQEAFAQQLEPGGCVQVLAFGAVEIARQSHGQIEHAGVDGRAVLFCQHDPAFSGDRHDGGDALFGHRKEVVGRLRGADRIEVFLADLVRAEEAQSIQRLDHVVAAVRPEELLVRG